MASADGMGDAGCKVNLCSWACITAYNHINHQARRELTAQYARTEKVVGPAVERVPAARPGAEVYRRGFDALIDKLGRAEPKRGELLRCVRDEARLSADAYRTVYEESLGFGRRKLERARPLRWSLPRSRLRPSTLSSCRSAAKCVDSGCCASRSSTARRRSPRCQAPRAQRLRRSRLTSAS